MILFSDACRFNLSHADRRERVYRRRGKRFADAYVIKQDRFGGSSVLVWVGIMGGNKTRLIVINGNINAQTYINDVLALEALPFIQFHGLNVTFMHDNPHSAAINGQFLATNNDRPAKSPNFKAIEQVWDELGRRVRRNHAIHTINELVAALQAVWANLPGQFSVTLTACTAVSQRALHKMVDTSDTDTFHASSVSFC